MTEHNINELAVAAIPAILGKGAAVAGKASKVIGAAKGAGKVAKRAAGALSANSEGIGTTSARVSEEVIDEAAAALAIPAAAALSKGAASIGAALTGANMLNGIRNKPKMDSFSNDFLKNGPSTPKPTTKKPLPTTAKLNTIKPSRDYQKEKQSASSSSVSAPAAGATKDATPSPKAATGAESATGAAAAAGTKTGAAAGTKTGAAAGAKTAAAAGLGAAAVAALKGKMKLGMPGADKDPGIGKTKARVKFKSRQTEEQLEVICDYLLDEGYASTGVEAENIYTHMSEEWKQYIVNS